MRNKPNRFEMVMTDDLKDRLKAESIRKKVSKADIVHNILDKKLPKIVR